MTSKEALNFLKWYIAEEDIRKEIEDITVKERIGIIQKNLEQLDHTREQLQKARKEKRRWKQKSLKLNYLLNELKEPYDDYISADEMYLCKREAYWDYNTDSLRYGYWLLKWNGEYEKRELNYIDPKTKQKKIWENKVYNPMLHFTSSKKEILNEEFIKERLKLIETITTGDKNDM